jgi:hypothetical protein
MGMRQGCKHSLAYAHEPGKNAPGKLNTLVHRHARESKLSLAHAYAPEGATMRRELFPGTCWFIPGNNSCAKKFWHISHMPVIINFQTLHLYFVVDVTARNQI